MEESNKEQKSMKLEGEKEKEKWMKEKVGFVAFNILVPYMFWYIFPEGLDMYENGPLPARCHSPLRERYK